jgi:hypothetical protein
MPDDVALWDGTRGAPPPQPMIANLSLAERRAACVRDVRMLNNLIERLTRNSDPDAIDGLMGADGKTRECIFSLDDDDREQLAQRMAEQEGLRIDPRLLTREGWKSLTECLAHRANLLLWLHRYCNGFVPQVSRSR